MDSNVSDIRIQIDGIAGHRKAIHKSTLILKRKTLTSPGYKKCSRLIRSLRREDLRLRRALFILRLQHSYDFLHHQPPSSPEAVASSSQISDNGNNSTTFVPAAADAGNDSADNHNASVNNAPDTYTDTNNDAGDAGNADVTGDFETATVSSSSTDSNATDNPNETGNIDESDVADEILEPPPSANYSPYDPQEPEVMSSNNMTNINLQLIHERRFTTDNLHGVYFGAFGNQNRHSVVAYGTRHLSAWSPDYPEELTDLTEFIPNCRIKKLVPLSDKILGLVANVKFKNGNIRKNKMVLFHINSALDDELDGVHPVSVWPDLSPSPSGVSTISRMKLEDDGTYFLSGDTDRNVYIHSFTQENGVFAINSSNQMDACMKSQVNALCYDHQNNRAVVGSIHGQISVVDGTTGGHIYDGCLNPKTKISRRPKITNLSICPTSPHLVMATCSTLNDQIRIVDMRMPIRPVLRCGMNLISNYSENNAPEWHPDGGVIVAPFNSDQTMDVSNILETYDTRFAGVQHTDIFYGTYNSNTKSISFSTEGDFNDHMMVTASTNGVVRFFSHSNVM